MQANPEVGHVMIHIPVGLGDEDIKIPLDSDDRLAVDSVLVVVDINTDDGSTDIGMFNDTCTSGVKLEDSIISDVVTTGGMIEGEGTKERT